MSLYLALGTTSAVAIFLRFRYGSQVIPYATATLLIVLFLFCPTSFSFGVGQWAVADQVSPLAMVDRLGEIVGFALLVLAAWIAGGPGGRRSP